MMLSDAVHVARRFQRSIRIDTDLEATGALQGFICHSSGQTALETMVRLMLETRQRAFTWTGPYGGGKSSLALVLSAAVRAGAKLRNAARALLEDVPRFSGAFPADQGGWLVLPVVGRRGDAIEHIRERLAEVIAAEPGKARTRRRRADKGGQDIIERLQAEAKARPDGGVLILLDEMGKYLEGAAAEGVDVHFFQELAEAAGRCEGRLIVLGILHQSFEQYASRLGGDSRDEWAKVQGRYVDIPLVTATDEVIDLLGQAIVTEIEHPESLPLAEQVADTIKHRRPGSPEDLSVRLDACWPLHPATAALLGPVTRRRFGQNERSLFGFLGSSEPNGFQEFLRSVPAVGRVAYDPSRLWDYLRINLEPAILASPDGHRWAQGIDAVERCEAKGTSLHIRLAKTIAMIDLFRNGSGLVPEREVLQASLSDASTTKIDQALDELEAWSIIVYRKHLGAWSIYDGSDFDIEKAVETAKAANGDLDLKQIASLADLQPVLAKRHYHCTGTLRWFETELIPLDQTNDAVQAFAPTDGSAGNFLLALPSVDDSEQKALKKCRGASKLADQYPVAVGLPRSVWLIRELGAELVALESVRATHPELEGDAVARREVRARIVATSSQLEEELRASFGDATWFVRGRLQACKDRHSLSRLVSEMADQTFDQAPVIHSELVNREKPSSNSQAGVRQLLYAMVTHPNEKLLGIEGYPAERGFYSTMLEASGLHGRRHDGSYDFMAPSADHPIGANFLPMWQRAEAILDDAQDLVPLSTLYEAWAAPPFGIRRGLLPILAVAFIQARRASVAVYAEGTFQPEVNDFVADLLLQGETLIQLRHVDLEGHNERILNDIARAIAETTDPVQEAAPLTVARALVGFIFKLPPWTRKTGSLSKESEAVRRVLLNASDPHRALFIDLPLIFEGTPPNRVGPRIGEALRELAAAYPRMLENLRRRMFSALSQKEGDFEGLRQRARTVAGLSGDLRLDALAARLSAISDAQADTEMIASFAINKPSRDWSDQDPDRAALALAELALKFRQAELLARVKGREPTRHALAIIVGTGEDGHALMKSFEVSKGECAEINRLAERVTELLEQSGADHHLLLAALAEAGARTIESADGVLSDLPEEAIAS